VIPAPQVISDYVLAVSNNLASAGDNRFLNAEVMRGLSDFLTLLAEIRVSRLNQSSPIDSLLECS